MNIGYSIVQNTLFVKIFLFGGKRKKGVLRIFLGIVQNGVEECGKTLADFLARKAEGKQCGAVHGKVTRSDTISARSKSLGRRAKGRDLLATDLR